VYNRLRRAFELDGAPARPMLGAAATDIIVK
jgi:hypothetical protein